MPQGGDVCPAVTSEARATWREPLACTLRRGTPHPWAWNVRAGTSTGGGQQTRGPGARGGEQTWGQLTQDPPPASAWPRTLGFSAETIDRLKRQTSSELTIPGMLPPCAGDTGRRLRGPCSAGQGPDANAKGSASSRPHPGAHGQQGSAGDKFPPASRGTSSLTLPWARSYSANSEPLLQAAHLYLTWPPPGRSVPASPTLPQARTAIAVHLFIPLERRAPRRQDGVLL